MGSDQSTSIDAKTEAAVEALSGAGTMPRKLLLKALRDIELEAEQTSVRKIVVTHPDHVRELIRVIKSCEFSRADKLREQEIVMHNKLRQSALRVLIYLTNGLDVAGSPQESLLHACRAQEEKEEAEAEAKREERRNNKDNNNNNNVSSSTTATTTKTEIDISTNGGFFGWGLGSIDKETLMAHAATQSSSMQDYEIEQFNKITAQICRLIGAPGELRFYLSKTTSPNEEEASLAVLLLRNITLGGGPKVSCRLSGFLLSPLLMRAYAPYKTELSIATSTCVYSTLRVLLMHPAYEEDRMLEFEAKSQERDFDGEIEMNEDGEHNEDINTFVNNDRIPFADTYENRTHERLLSLGLIESMISHVSYGIPHPALMQSILECLFELLSGSNLMFMAKNEEASNRIDMVRRTTMEKSCILKYDDSYTYDSLIVTHIRKETTIIDVLQWITADVRLPKWVSKCEDYETHLPFPWNLNEAGKRYPHLKTASARALRMLVASVQTVEILAEVALPHPPDARLKRPVERHLQDTGIRNRQFEADAADAVRMAEDADDEEDDIIDEEYQKNQSSKSKKKNNDDSSDSATTSSSSDSDEDEEGPHADLHPDYIVSDDSHSESSEDSEQDNESWEQYVHISLDIEQEEQVDISTENGDKLLGERAKQQANENARNRIEAFRAATSVHNLLERIDKKREDGRSVRKLTSALLVGVEKNWHRRLILKASTANRGGRSSLGSAGLIASLRRLSQRNRHRDEMLIDARRDLRDEVFGSVAISKSEHRVTVVPVEELSISHLSISCESKSANQWRAVKSSVVSDKGYHKSRGDRNFIERIYYTVSHSKNRHDLPPLWELSPPERFMSALGTPASYTVEFQEGELGLSFDTTIKHDVACGVEIASIVPSSQADLGKYGNINIGDQLNRVNGQNVRGINWDKRRVLKCIKKAKRPLLLSFSGKEVIRFIQNLHDTAKTKRWSPACEDSVWEEPADAKFRIIRVRVAHRQEITEAQISAGKCISLSGGTGLLYDERSGTKDAFLVEMSHIHSADVYNRATLSFNKARIFKRFIEIAKARNAQQIILETFASGFGVVRKKNTVDHTLLELIGGIPSRLGLIYNNLHVSKSKEVRYYAAATILQLLITARHTSATGNATTFLLLELFRGQRDSNGTNITPGEGLLEIFQPGLVPTPIPDIRGHVPTMYASHVILNVSRLVKRMNMTLAKKTVMLIIPTVRHLLERFKDLDDVTRRQVLASVSQMSHRADPTCANVLWEGKCYHAISNATKMLCSTRTKLAMVETLVSGSVHVQLKAGMRTELRLKETLTRLVEEASYSLASERDSGRNQNDSSESGKSDVMIMLEKLRQEKILGCGNISEIPYHLSPNDLLRSKHGVLIESIVSIVENAKNAVQRWKALGAIAVMTKMTNACQLIVKKHQSLLVDITRYAQEHDAQYGHFGATLGQFEAVQIMANLTMHPGSLLLWCQFSEGYKLTMDYTGNFSPCAPLDDTSGMSCPPHKRCVNCHRIRGTGMDDSTADVLQVRRRGKWYKLGVKWWCVNCYADVVPGRKPAWIYREEESELSSWREKGKAKYATSMQASQSNNKSSRRVNGVDNRGTKDTGSRKRTATANQNTSSFSPAFSAGCSVRISSGNFAGREGTIVGVPGIAREFTTDESQKYIIEVPGGHRSAVEARSLIFQSGPSLPPLRWGAKFGERSMVFLSKKGVKLPEHGWSISVWFRTGKWIKPLASRGKYRTLCESSNGDKIIALNHDMRFCSVQAPSSDNDQEWTVHGSTFRLHDIKSSLRNQLGLDSPDALVKTVKWVHLVVTGSPGRETSSKSTPPTMTYYLNGVLVDTVVGNCPKCNVQVLGNAAIGFQSWEALSDFRIYSHSLPSESLQWPHDIQQTPPTNAVNSMKWSEKKQSKSDHPSFVRGRIVAAGCLACLSLVMRLADFVSIRRAAMCAVANIACVPLLRHKIIQVDGFVDMILTMVSRDHGDAKDQGENTTSGSWIKLETKELLKYTRIAALALR